MKMAPMTPEALQGLPGSISMQKNRHVSVYHGTPVEMVRQMASEMGLTGIRESIETLLTALGHNRGILIVLPEDAPEEVLAAMFVYALLESGVSRPITAKS